jgi:UDP-N-acetylglucosamine transferase subunit ALG13
MIFVTVGTNEARFDRLLRATESLRGDEEIVVQHGPSDVRPAGATCVDYLEFDAMVEHVDRSRVVVTHAGVGSILLALSRGRRPVVVPRRRSFGEAVDDHQVPLARRLAELGLVTVVEDPERGLREAVAGDGANVRAEAGATRLADDLRHRLALLIGGSA